MVASMRGRKFHRWN